MTSIPGILGILGILNIQSILCMLWYTWYTNHTRYTAVYTGQYPSLAINDGLCVVKAACYKQARARLQEVHLSMPRPCDKRWTLCCVRMETAINKRGLL